jgi:sensor histidine kinase YesM
MLNFFFKSFKEWASVQELELKLQEAKKEALKVQLENLKAQVNPHFLFNTLNNIYSLSLFNDERTPETILKLSDLLSYMIYECRDDKVKVEDEIKFIENYTSLEKIRFNENAILEMKLDKNWNSYEIAPLLLAPFLENAFKHGMNITSREPKISVSISNSVDDKLHFICENYTDNIKNPGPGGIGLKNVKARLNLLYPKRHELKIENDGKIFKVDLTIDISKGPELSFETQKVIA